MHKWRIYYDDGSTFDNTMGQPEQAPAYGIICIVQLHPENGRSTLHRWDWYYWKDDVESWFGSDIHGLLDQLCHDSTKSICGVRQGRTVLTNRYNEILMKAADDSDFPVQSAHDDIEGGAGFVEKRTR